MELAGARGEAKPDAGSGKGKGGRPTKGDKGGVKEKDEEEGDDLYDKYAYLDEF